MEHLYIVIPAYNEQDNLETAIQSWNETLTLNCKDTDYRIIVINDGSSDRTLEIGKKLENSIPFLKIIDRPHSGHGPALIFGYHYAINAGADYIFQTDSDNQTSPSEFIKFWELREKYTGIFGSRTYRNDGFIRILAEKIVCLLCRFYFGIRIPDANAPFRLMRTDRLKEYLPLLPSDYPLPNIMLTVYFTYFQESTLFRSITFKKRFQGMSTINFHKLFITGWHTLHDFWQFRKHLKTIS